MRALYSFAEGLLRLRDGRSAFYHNLPSSPCEVSGFWVPIASAPHREFGMSTMTWGTASSHVVCDAFTGETVAVDIPAAMKLLRTTYKLEFSDDGCGYFSGIYGDGKGSAIFVKLIPF